MNASKSPLDREQVDPKKRRKPSREVAQFESICEETIESEWFDAFDARSLLNSMTRKVRTGPPAKPLTRI